MSNTFKIEYPLPYWIPLSHHIFVEKRDNDKLIRISIEEEREVRIIREVRSDYPISLVTLEIIHDWHMKYDADEFPGEVINNIFEYGLGVVNQLIDYIRSCTDLLYIHNVTTTELPSVVSFTVNGIKRPMFTCPHRLVGENSNSISPDQFMIIWDQFNALSILPHIHFYDKSRSDFIQGRKTDSIVNLQISFEAFIRYLIICLAKEEGLEIQKLKKALELPFRHQLEYFLSKRLSRKLYYESNPVISSWKKNVYDLRNATAHEGMIPSVLDIRKAIKVFIRTHNYIAELVNNKLKEREIKKVHIGSINQIRDGKLFDELVNKKILFYPEFIPFRLKVRFKFIRIKNRIKSVFSRLTIWILRKIDNGA